MTEKNFIVEFIRSEKYNGIKIAKKDKLIVKLCPVIVRGDIDNSKEQLKLIESLAKSIFKDHRGSTKISKIDVPEVDAEYYQIEYIGIFDNDGSFNILNQDLDISNNAEAIDKLTSQIVPDSTIGSDICFISFIGNKKECKAVQVATILSDASLSLGFITPEDMGGYIYARDAKEIYNIAYRCSDDNDDLADDPYIDDEDIRVLPEVVRTVEGHISISDSHVVTSENMIDDKKEAIVKEIKLIFDYFGANAEELSHDILGDNIVFDSDCKLRVSTEGGKMTDESIKNLKDELVVIKELWDDILVMDVRINSEEYCDSSVNLKKMSEFYISKCKADGWLAIGFGYSLVDVDDDNRMVSNLLHVIKLDMKGEDGTSEPIHLIGKF